MQSLTINSSNYILYFYFGGKKHGSKNQIKKNGTEESTFL